MNEQETLFGRPLPTMTYEEAARWADSTRGFEPKARASDSQTSHEAAATVKPGNGALIQAIRKAVELRWHPCSAFEIAAYVERRNPKRWKEGSIRTRISAIEKDPDGFLEVADEEGREGKCSVRRYRMRGA